MNDVPAASDQRPVVLIVEDDSFISTDLENSLAESFWVVTAANGAEAREILTKHPVALIVLDILLPDENGFAFLEGLKRDSSPYKDIPILILSNLDQPEDIAQGKKLGAVDYLVKAKQLPSDVVKKITSILGRPGA